MSEKSSIQIGKKAFIGAVVILLALIIFSGILSRVIPSGSYDRVVAEGRRMVVDGSFRYIEKTPLPVWRWFTAPVEVIWGDNMQMVIVLIIFMIFIGGSFTILEKGRIMETMLALTVSKFISKKYLLMAIIIFFFMFAAAVLGIYEAMVPMIVFIVPLALILGWDSLTGLGMSLLALSFGFSAAITNPFTIGVAQTIADLPLFSGALLRICFFIITYVLVFLFVRAYARRIEKDPSRSLVYHEDSGVRSKYSPESLLEGKELAKNKGMVRAIRWVAASLGLAVVFMITAALVPAIPTDFAFPVVALLFFIGGIGAGSLAGLKGKALWGTFGNGVAAIMPGILLILMAMSVPHIMTRGGVMDSILYSASGYIAGTSSYVAGFLVYLLTFILNFFISSASAKAFLMMPILTPLADLVGLTRQTVVLAFDFGDGFSNMLFPTNALLLVGLGLTVVSYTKWIRWTVKIQGIVFVISMAFLAFAIAIGFGPF